VLRKNDTPDIQTLLQTEPDRASDMVLAHGRWRLDASRVPLPLADWHSRFADERVKPLKLAIDSLFAGDQVNRSEARPALHTALRASEPENAGAVSDFEIIDAARERMLDFAARLHAGRSSVRTLIHVGIGGSDLGPRLVADALDAGDGAVGVEWLTTLDARRLYRLLERLDPASTGLVVASKSFTTVETLTQARVIRDWLGQGWRDRSWAATANRERAVAFGIRDDHVLEFPAGVGGRFSLWSGVGISAAARIGPERWKGLLAGANSADEDLRGSPASSAALGLAVAIDALIRQFGFRSLGVVAYDPRLRLLADHLQQLIMESLGKSVDVDGRALDEPTGPLVFGGPGTDLQHSAFQALHQGTTRHPMLLVGTLEPVAGFDDWQHEQLAHLLGQASALVNGRRSEQPHEVLPGNNPVMLLLSGSLTPETLGELLATFEHAVYLLGAIWNINPFDQWGVEEGKRLAGSFRKALSGDGDGPDPEMAATIEWIRNQR
jgi:glucose-6-phosphate isomerase